jgi:BASS family bile acid:Na+ symporter
MGHRDSKAVSIEVGIQNSALGLILIFTFFDGLGGMALVAAWWGVWHLIAGLTMGSYWSHSKATKEQELNVRQKTIEQ